MTYNIHPLFVHFPIAFLLVYSVIKILPLKQWVPQVSWKQIERTLLFVGIIGAFAALYTGGIAEELVKPNYKLVETHSFFAATSTWIFGILLVGELLSMLVPVIKLHIKSELLIQVAIWLKNLLTHPVLSTLLALTGLLTISITGLLGGVMVYGTSADPLASILLKLLGITL